MTCVKTLGFTIAFGKPFSFFDDIFTQVELTLFTAELGDIIELVELTEAFGKTNDSVVVVGSVVREAVDVNE